MSEKEFNKIVSKHIRLYLEMSGMTQVELAKRLGVGATSVYNWVHGVKAPRMKYIDAMCKIFNCKRSDFITDIPDAALMDASQLSIDDCRILDMICRLDPADRAEVTQFIQFKLSNEKYKKRIISKSENIIAVNFKGG